MLGKDMLGKDRRAMERPRTQETDIKSLLGALYLSSYHLLFSGKDFLKPLKFCKMYIAVLDWSFSLKVHDISVEVYLFAQGI